METGSRGDGRAHLGRESDVDSQDHGQAEFGCESHRDCGGVSSRGSRAGLPGDLRGVSGRPQERRGGHGGRRAVPGSGRGDGAGQEDLRYFSPVATGASVASDHSLKLPS